MSLAPRVLPAWTPGVSLGSSRLAKPPNSAPDEAAAIRTIGATTRQIASHE